MLSITKQLICKLAVLQSQPTVLSLLGILSLDWNFWPLFRDFRRSIKMCEMNYRISFCKSYFVLFLIFIIGTPIFLLHHHIFRDFFGNCSRDFWSFICESSPSQVRQCPNWIRGGIAENLGFSAKFAQMKNRLCQFFRSQILLRQLSYTKLIDEIQRAESP